MSIIGHDIYHKNYVEKDLGMNKINDTRKDRDQVTIAQRDQVESDLDWIKKYGQEHKPSEVMPERSYRNDDGNQVTRHPVEETVTDIEDSYQIPMHGEVVSQLQNDSSDIYGLVDMHETGSLKNTASGFEMETTYEQEVQGESGEKREVQSTVSKVGDFTTYTYSEEGGGLAVFKFNGDDYVEGFNGVTGERAQGNEEDTAKFFKDIMDKEKEWLDGHGNREGQEITYDENYTLPVSRNLGDDYIILGVEEKGELTTYSGGAIEENGVSDMFETPSMAIFEDEENARFTYDQTPFDFAGNQLSDTREVGSEYTKIDGEIKYRCFDEDTIKVINGGNYNNGNFLAENFPAAELPEEDVKTEGFVTLP
jgi:hypothetical protein